MSKSDAIGDIKRDWAELTSVYSITNRNRRGGAKFASLNKTSRFAQLCKKLWMDKWLGFNDPKRNIPLWEKYNDEIDYQSQRIVNELMDENGIITTENGIKLVTENINNTEFVHQYYNIFYSDPLLPIKDVKFRNACGAFWCSFLENINFEGGYQIIGTNIEKGDVVLDIGGGYGFFALMALKLGAKCVHVFEPNDNARQIILKNRELNGYTKEQMPVYKYALGAKRKSAILYTQANTHCTGVIRDLDPDKPRCITHETKITEVITLDDFYRKLDEKQQLLKEQTGYYNPPKIDYIKINTNGLEHEILQGAAYWFTYIEFLPDITMTIYKRPDEYRKCEEVLEAFTANYGFRLRVAKLHAIFNYMDN